MNTFFSAHPGLTEKHFSLISSSAKDWHKKKQRIKAMTKEAMKLYCAVADYSKRSFQTHVPSQIVFGTEENPGIISPEIFLPE